MSFTYQFGANPIIDYPRMLIGDTADQDHIFEDSEILAARSIVSLPFQSSMFYSGTAGQSLPGPVSPYRVAAVLLKSIASNKARISVSKLLDVNITPAQTAKALLDQANDWMEMEDNSGSFAIIEQATTGFSFMDRFYKQVQRQTAQ